MIGCSAGGLAALTPLLGALDPTMARAVVACIHSGAHGAGLPGPLLARQCRLPVREAPERRPVQAGTVYLAPPGYSLLIERGRRFALSVDMPGALPAPVHRRAVRERGRCYGARLAGVVLTGASADGTQGLVRIRLGGLAIVQDPSEAPAPAMPQAALAYAGADHCLPLTRIASLLDPLAHGDE